MNTSSDSPQGVKATERPWQETANLIAARCRVAATFGGSVRLNSVAAGELATLVAILPQVKQRLDELQSSNDALLKALEEAKALYEAQCERVRVALETLNDAHAQMQRETDDYEQRSPKDLPGIQLKRVKAKGIGKAISILDEIGFSLKPLAALSTGAARWN